MYVCLRACMCVSIYMYIYAGTYCDHPYVFVDKACKVVQQHDDHGNVRPKRGNGISRMDTPAMTFRRITKVRPEWYKRAFRSRRSFKTAKSPSKKEATKEIMAYRTRLTVSTAIRKTIQGIRTQSLDGNRYHAHVNRCAASLVLFIESNGTLLEGGMLVPICENLMFSVLAEIQAYYRNLHERLDVFKADDTKILGTKEIKLAEDLIRTAEDRGRSLEEFLNNLNTELVEIIYLSFSDGRYLNAIDQFIRVAEVVEKARTEIIIVIIYRV